MPKFAGLSRTVAPSLTASVALVSSGASFTAVTVMLRVTVLLSTVPSLTMKPTVRTDVLGLSLLLRYVTVRSAAS